MLFYHKCRKKKSKQQKEKAKNIDVPRQDDKKSELVSKPKDKRTPAQIAFHRVQEKRVSIIVAK